MSIADIPLPKFLTPPGRDSLSPDQHRFERRVRKDRTDPEGGIPGRVSHADLRDVAAAISQLDRPRPGGPTGHPPLKPQPEPTYAGQGNQPGRRYATATEFVDRFVKQMDETHKQLIEEAAEQEKRIASEARQHAEREAAGKARLAALVEEAEKVAAMRDGAKGLLPKAAAKTATETGKNVVQAGNKGDPLLAAHACDRSDCPWTEESGCVAEDCPWRELEVVP
jgi:hypothetical protein